MKTVGVYIWQGMTALDAIGPQNILGFVPDFDVVTVAASRDVVVTDTKLRIVPDHDLASCPPVDILVVGGGIDPSKQMTDDDVMEWMRTTGASAEYVTSVCTGALILAEAGLLDGYRATTHWAYRKQLATYAVEVVDQRVVTDRNRITGGGVTAGIDFALAIVSEVAGAEVAGGLQLMGEYDPQPPTRFGSPATAPAELVAAVRAQFEALSPGLTEFFAAKSA
jgi:transcriptional regulator GlxA family with amidase domain